MIEKAGGCAPRAGCPPDAGWGSWPEEQVGKTDPECAHDYTNAQGPKGAAAVEEEGEHRTAEVDSECQPATAEQTALANSFAEAGQDTASWNW